MSDLEALGDKIKHISSEIQKSPRVDPDDPLKTGWGQFVDAPAHIAQIGPYGTSAALLIQSFSHPEAPVPDSAITQLEAFWAEPPDANKLYTQNVRAAFLVLALAKTTDAKLVALRTAVLDELRSRQRQDGGWPDGVVKGTVHPISRTEPTAWVILAIDRAVPGDDAALKGAKFIQSQVTDLPNSALVSPIAAAAALSVLPASDQTIKLIRRGTQILKNQDFSQEEYISFFDYSEVKNNIMRMSRDYLCFPSFYPSALLIDGISKVSHPYTKIQISIFRNRLVENLLKIIPDSSLYRLPGAQFSATVDQALIALSVEKLESSRSIIDPVMRRLKPIGSWVSNSFLIRVLLPLALLTVAIATLADPVAIPQALSTTAGIDTKRLTELATANAGTIRVVVALMLAIVPSMPASAWGYMKKKFGP